MLNEWNWRNPGLYMIGYETEKLILIFPLFYKLNPYFYTKANDNHQSSIEIFYNEYCNNKELKLVIVIGFGAKICIQLVEKGEIQNKFFFSIPNHVYPRKRQLHLLSIVKFRGFQCSRLFLGLFCNFKFPYMYICTCFGFP